MELRVCRKCDLEKEISCFYRAKGNTCYECKKSIDRAREKRTVKNREIILLEVIKEKYPPRICLHCHISKDVCEFRSPKNGRVCLTCKRIQEMNYKRKEERKQKFNKYSKEYYEKSKDKAKDKALRNNYNISLEEYEIILKSQNYVCALCKNSEHSFGNKNNKIKNLAVDHCHETNKVRGLLCMNCNTALGKLGDSVASIEKVLNYLKKS